MLINNITCTRKILKYILMGMIVLSTARYIPSNTLSTKDIIIIGAMSSISFALLDMYAPSVRINLE